MTSNNGRFIWMVLIMVILHLKCKPRNYLTNEQLAVLQKIEQTVSFADSIHAKLRNRADSLKSINEFEAIKVYNALNISEENVASLRLYIDTLNLNPELTENLENTLLMAETQAAYVRSLASAGAAMLSDRSFSFGNWQKNSQQANRDTTSIKANK